MAINLIIAAEPFIESRLNKQQGHNNTNTNDSKIQLTLDALCFRALSACLEGRKDQACHLLLREHVEMDMLYEKARALDSKCRVAIARSKTFLDGSSEMPVNEGQLAADLDALAKLWSIHCELFPEVRKKTTMKEGEALVKTTKRAHREINYLCSCIYEFSSRYLSG